MAGDNRPLVSIVIINFNYARFLDPVISSCLNQTYPHKEIIVVDDGSTDNSREVMSAYGDKIIPVVKDNGGQGSALNAGFARSHGDLVLFLDSDDLLEPDVLEEAVRRWDGKATKIHYRLDVIDPSGAVIGQNPASNLALPEGNIQSSLITVGHYVTPPNSGNIYSRKFIEAVYPIPEQPFRVAADSYYYTLAPLYGEILALHRVGGKYRMHGANGFLKKRRYSSAKDLLGALQRYDRCLGLIEKFVKEKGLKNTYSAKYYFDGNFNRLLFLRVENKLDYRTAFRLAGNIFYGVFADKTLGATTRAGWIAKALLVGFAPLPLVWRFYPNTRPEHPAGAPPRPISGDDPTKLPS